MLVSAMNTLEIIGVISLCYIGCRVAVQASKCIYIYLVKAHMRKDAILKEKNRWALVTGGTDGIGKAYANALAKIGLNIVLVSRDIKKLHACADEIASRHNVQTKVVVADFTSGMEIYDDIEKATTGLEIGVLVNNVGISYSYPEVFLQIPDREKVIGSMIKANVISVTKMCELIMPGMVERHSGVVINVSSAAAVIPSPLLTVYAATKAYVEKFSDELRNEYESQGIVIQTILPGYVATKMAKIKKSTWLAPTAEKFVASALSKVGVQDHTTGYYPHTLFVNTINTIHRVCRPFALYLVTRTMQNIRSRALASQKKRLVMPHDASS